LGADVNKKDADDLFPLIVLLHYRNSYSLIKYLVGNQNIDLDVKYKERNIIDYCTTLKHYKLMEFFFIQKQMLPTCSQTYRLLESGSLKINWWKEFSKRIGRILWETIKNDRGNKPNMEVGNSLFHLKNTCKYVVPDKMKLKSNGYTPLYYAVKEEKSIELIKILLRSGSDPNVKDKCETPMIYYPLLKSDDHSDKIVSVLLPKVIINMDLVNFIEENEPKHLDHPSVLKYRKEN